MPLTQTSVPAMQNDSTTEALEYFPPVDTHLIRSQHVAQMFKIHVVQPPQKRGETSEFPVVYVTDGNRVFEMFKGICEIIQASGYDAPRFIFVSIGYPSDSPRGGAMLRTRDFTFAGYPKFTLMPPPVEGMLMPEEGTKQMYGAEDFRSFLEHELIPFVDGKYRTIRGDRTYFGHSGGGGFGLFTLFTQPELFTRYIVSSPSMLFHGKVDGVEYHNCDFLFQYARQFIASGKALADVRLHMSVGTEEEYEAGVELWQLTSSFFLMSKLLKAVPGLKLTAEVLPGETHMTAWPIAFIHGIQTVFGMRIRGS